MEPTDHHRHALLAQRPRNIERAGKLVRLHADNANESQAAVLRDAPRDRSRLHSRVGFIDRENIDGKRGAEDLARGSAHGKAIDGSERVRRHGRAEPLHDITVSVVMRWLDEDELEAPAVCFAHHQRPLFGMLALSGKDSWRLQPTTPALSCTQAGTRSPKPPETRAPGALLASHFFSYRSLATEPHLRAGVQ